jgi:hypothetical protein
MKASLRKRTFSPLRDKKLESILLRLFVDEFGYEKKVIFAQVIIQRILVFIDAMYKSASF